jgi:hypothetical protein
MRANNLTGLIDQVKQACGYNGKEHQVFVMVEGLNNWTKEKVRGGLSLDKLETGMLGLGLKQHISVVSTAGTEDVARWLHELSLDIAYRPYKSVASHSAHVDSIVGRLRQRAHNEGLTIDFSSKDGVSKAGDYKSTFIAQLQAMFNITPGASEDIVKKYGTWRNLYEAYEALPTLQQRKDMLVGIEPGRKKTTGGETDRKLGKALSARCVLTRVLWQSDPMLAEFTDSSLSANQTLEWISTRKISDALRTWRPQEGKGLRSLGWRDFQVRRVVLRLPLPTRRFWL